MRVELVAIGDELLLGFTVDTNSAFIARELSALGVAVGRRLSVGDDEAEITSAVSEALARAQGVIVTGGIGPTNDDVTRPALAAAFGRRLRRDDAIVAHLESLWRSRGRSGSLPSANLSQALVPEGARVIDNPYGSAPGFWLEREDGRWAAVMPGVPREMRAMFTESVKTLVAQRAGGTAVIQSLTLRTTGVPESQLPGMLGDLAGGAPAVSLAYLPLPDGVDLRLTVRGHPPSESAQLLHTTASLVRDRLGPAIYAEGDVDLAAVVIDECRRHRLTVGVAESCTGGLLGSRLASVPGASDVFRGGVIAYDNSVKIDSLGVPAALLEEQGAVSEPVVVAMAAGVRSATGAELGVAITGIAGPAGGSAEKPVGTVWLALADRSTARARQLRFFGDRNEIRRRASQAALDLIRRKLAG
jgi:nicotinamide-nucleotide amidase